MLIINYYSVMHAAVSQVVQNIEKGRLFYIVFPYMRELLNAQQQFIDG